MGAAISIARAGKSHSTISSSLPLSVWLSFNASVLGSSHPMFRPFEAHVSISAPMRSEKTALLNRTRAYRDAVHSLSPLRHFASVCLGHWCLDENSRGGADAQEETERDDAKRASFRERPISAIEAPVQSCDQGADPADRVADDGKKAGRIAKPRL